MTQPSRSLEVEVTFDAGAHTAVPDWRGLPGVVVVGPAQTRDLDATYFDTATYQLGRAQYALRRRLGGPDAGWHLKGPRQGAGRVETGWPLELTGDPGTGSPVPARILAHIASLVTEPLVPIARIRNARTAYALMDAEGGLIAEMVDDHVQARDELRGVERRWREWEIELGPAGPVDDAARAAFFASVAELAFIAGAREASSDSKLARALGM